MMRMLLFLFWHAAAAAPVLARHDTNNKRASSTALAGATRAVHAAAIKHAGAATAGVAGATRGRAQHASALKHAQLVHLHNRTRLDLARRHRPINATNATRPNRTAAAARDERPRRAPGGDGRRPPARADATEARRRRRGKKPRDAGGDPRPREQAAPAVLLALSGLALACFAARAVFTARGVDDAVAAGETSPAKARRVELRAKLLAARAVPPPDAPPPPHPWSSGELDDEVDAPSPVLVAPAAAPRP
jgi:hypothetical protein